jgi:hypothetical protein
MKKPPKSYLNCKRPPIEEALKLEGGTMGEAMASLERKGYFTPPPRPWTLGFKGRGLGRGDFAVLDRFNELIVETKDHATAELIVSAVNAASGPKQ